MINKLTNDTKKRKINRNIIIILLILLIGICLYVFYSKYKIEGINNSDQIENFTVSDNKI